MKRADKIKLVCGVLEAVLATCAVAEILERDHPYIAVGLLALARGTAYAKTFFQEKQNPDV